jgi:hypothetical protein
MKLSLKSFSNFKALKFYNVDFQSFAIKAKTKKNLKENKKFTFQEEL